MLILLRDEPELLAIADALTSIAPRLPDCSQPAATAKLDCDDADEPGVSAEQLERE